MITFAHLWVLYALGIVSCLFGFGFGVCACLGPGPAPEPLTVPRSRPPLPRAGRFPVLVEERPPPPPPDGWDTGPVILWSDLAASAADLDRFARTYQGHQSR